MKKRRLLLGGVIIVVLVAAVLGINSRGTEVEILPAGLGEINREVTDAGFVQPVESWTLYADQNARVVEISAETGQAVKADQVIMALENNDLSIQVNEVQSQLTQAEADVSGCRTTLQKLELELAKAEDDFARVEKLFQEGVVTQVEYADARLQTESIQKNVNAQRTLLGSVRSQVNGLRKNLEQLKNKEHHLIVKSPQEGIILNLPVKEEEMVLPGTMLVSVSVPGKLEIKADILSDDLAEVKIGQEVIITAPVLGDLKLTGHVKKIYPQAEEKQSALGITQRRVPVIISLTETGNLKPGYEVQAAIKTVSKKNIIVVPRDAVRTTKDNKKQVMIVEDGRVKTCTVETGISDAENIEILSGLKEGEQVIRDAGLELEENQKVKIRETGV